MSNFNFSKPTPKHTNEKKVSVLGKIWAGLNLVALFGDFIIPKKHQDNIPIKYRNMIILFLLFVVLYMIGCGVFLNVQWIIHAIGKINFSFGEGFYYFGILIIIFCALGYLNIEKEMLDLANQKKIIISSVNNIKDFKKNTGFDPFASVKKSLQQHKSFTALFAIMGLISFIWTAWGIIFYDRILFIILIALSPLSSVIMIPIKNMKIVRMIFIADIIVTIIFISSILINHFFIF